MTRVPTKSTCVRLQNRRAPGPYSTVPYAVLVRTVPYRRQAASDRRKDKSERPKRMKRNNDGGSAKEGKKKQKKEFDFTRFQSRKIALKFAYLGFVVPEGLVQQENDDGTVEEPISPTSPLPP